MSLAGLRSSCCIRSSRVAECSITHSAEMPRSSQALSPLSLCHCPRPEAIWQSNAHPCSLTQPALGLLNLPSSPSPRGQCPKPVIPKLPLGLKSFGDLSGEQWQNPTSAARSTEVYIWVLLPYSYISQISGKPKVLQNDPMPILFPAAHH